MLYAYLELHLMMRKLWDASVSGGHAPQLGLPQLWSVKLGLAYYDSALGLASAQLARALADAGEDSAFQCCAWGRDVSARTTTKQG